CSVFVSRATHHCISTLSLPDALPIWARRPPRSPALRSRSGSTTLSQNCRRWRHSNSPRSRRGNAALEKAPHSNPPFHSGNREGRSEEHTSELQSRENLVCRLLLEKKK